MSHEKCWWEWCCWLIILSRVVNIPSNPHWDSDEIQPDSEILTRGSSELQGHGAIIKILRDVRQKYWLNALYIRTEPQPQPTPEVIQTENPLRFHLISRGWSSLLNYSHYINQVVTYWWRCKHYIWLVRSEVSPPEMTLLACCPGVLHKHPHDTWYSSRTSNFTLLPL